MLCDDSKSNGTVAQVYAYHLMERIIVKCDHLLDLHTASRGRMNSLYVRADMNNPRTHAMARLQNPQVCTDQS
jgi:predicted deacylase